MKKLLMGASIMLFLFSCQNEPNDINVVQKQQTKTKVPKRACGTREAFLRELKADPTLAGRMRDLENFTQKVTSSSKLANTSIVVPVVFNVIYSNESENLSLAQLQSQIDILNKDFNARNSDFNNPTPYASVKANVCLTFILDKVVRKYSPKKYWFGDDAMKLPEQGGIEVTESSRKLNIWIVNYILDEVDGYEYLGYAYFPGVKRSIDGVVLGSNYVGDIGTAIFPYNLGRTATHEVGHWLNLDHIWGDDSAICASDLVADTPAQDEPNFGTPPAGLRSTCSGTPLEMFMNYMDYVDDSAMFMFSKGQKSRMRAVFAPGGRRDKFVD
jgi:hypothetical protein